MLIPCLAVGCLSGSAEPDPADTRYVVTKPGQLFSLEVLWEKFYRWSDPGAQPGLAKQSVS